MSLDPVETPALTVEVERPIHPGLTLQVALCLGCECGVVFGRSGAGKTSLLRLIAGLDRPRRGRIILGGATLFDDAARIDLPLRSRRLAMVFQDDLLFPHLSVAQNLRYGLRGLPRRDADSRVEEVAELCGVGGLLARWPATLSGGERQRVGLARALAPRPRLLLCDEPVSALDVASRNALIDQLDAVRIAEAIPVLYVTHSPSEAVRLGQRLFLLEQGRILAEGRPLDVLAAADGATRFDGFRNVFPAIVREHASERGETRVTLVDGPELIVPFQNLSPGTRVSVSVLAEEILLARGPLIGVSARNRIMGTVARVVSHGADAELIVRTGQIDWIVSVVMPAVTNLELAPGANVHMIVKARSCHVETVSASFRSTP